jgi:vacuolar-type H+-ATPase subunit C/Vma6
MISILARDFDFLAARLHGHRSRMAEGVKLDALCRIHNVADLARTVFAEAEPLKAIDFQRALVQELLHEISRFRAHLAGAGVGLFEWIPVRFQVENLKVLIRACITKTPFQNLNAHLISLPGSLALKAETLATAGSTADFATLLRRGPIRKSLEEAIAVLEENPAPFFLEAAFDRGYFRELLSRTDRLPKEDTRLIRPLVCQEVDVFHTMLVMRGIFHYALAPELLLPFHVAGTGIPFSRFTAMLRDPDPGAAAQRLIGRVIDELPSERGSGEAGTSISVASIEDLAWKRFLRLAEQAFRVSHMGLAAIVGYVGIRRVEVANLITVSEGLRHELHPDTIRARLIPRAGQEAAHV